MTDVTEIQKALRALAKPIPSDKVRWRRDSAPKPGKDRQTWYARYVAYITAQTVRERLDQYALGHWSLALEPLERLEIPRADTKELVRVVAFKARLTVFHLAREDVGHGTDYKKGSSDAFKRAAVRFGIAHELYELGHAWVRMTSGAKDAEPAELPIIAYNRYAELIGKPPMKLSARSRRELEQLAHTTATTQQREAVRATAAEAEDPYRS